MFELTLINVILFYLIYTFFVWVFFVVAIRSKKALEEKFNNSKWVMYPFNLFIGLPFIIFDFALNILMTVVYSILRFRDMGVIGAIKYSIPDFRGADYYIPLYTHRLRVAIMKDDMDSNTFKLSVWFCKYLIEPHDKGHCRLSVVRERIEQAKKDKEKNTL